MNMKALLLLAILTLISSPLLASDFSISPEYTDVEVNSGQDLRITTSLNRLDGFSEPVRWTSSGSTAILNDSPDRVTFWIQGDLIRRPGDYTFSISATSVSDERLRRSADVHVLVISPDSPAPHFKIALDTTNFEINAGEEIRVPLHLRRRGGFADSITWSSTGASVIINDLRDPDHSTFWIPGTLTSSPGDFTYSVFATSIRGTSLMIRRGDVHVRVRTPASPREASPWTLSVTPLSCSAPQGGTCVYTINVEGARSADLVEFSLGGAPEEIMREFVPERANDTTQLTLRIPSNAPVSATPLSLIIKGLRGMTNVEKTVSLQITPGLGGGRGPDAPMTVDTTTNPSYPIAASASPSGPSSGNSSGTASSSCSLRPNAIFFPSEMICFFFLLFATKLPRFLKKK